MEIKYCIKAWITNAAAVLEAVEVNLCFLRGVTMKTCKSLGLKFLAAQQQQQKKKTCRSYSTGNAEDSLSKAKKSLYFY